MPIQVSVNQEKCVESIKNGFVLYFSSLIACLHCLPCMSPDSSSSDAPVYFEIVAEVSPAAEQGKSCLSLDHVDTILQMF